MGFTLNIFEGKNGTPLTSFNKRYFQNRHSFLNNFILLIFFVQRIVFALKN